MNATDTRKDKSSSPDSLREQLYHYLQNAMLKGTLEYGKFIDQDRICSDLGVSKAPLRDALIRLEAEGFVTILPRRGVFLTPLSSDFIKSAYQIIGSVEADCMNEVFHLLTKKHIAQFERSNALQYDYLIHEQYEKYFLENIAFHDIFLSLAKNVLLKKIIDPLRMRLCHFPQREYLKSWELENLQTHQRIIDSIMKGNRAAAVSIIRVEHWGWDNHKDFVEKYYSDVNMKD